MSQRIEKLREIALNANVYGFRGYEANLFFYEGYEKSYSANSLLMRNAMAKEYVLSNATPVINEYELIVGRPRYEELSDEDMQKLNGYQEKSHAFMPRYDGQSSHMAIDYEKVLKKGIIGVVEEILEYKSSLDITKPQDLDKDDFYSACLKTLNGVKEYSQHYSDHAKLLAKSCIDEKRKQELLYIAEITARVPLNPATNFYEAVQSIHFITVCLEGLYQLGHPDRFLIEYYTKDVQAGKITKEYAQELIDCLCVMFHMYIPSSLAVGFMVGGKDKTGKTVLNDLTYMFLESIRHTRMAYPGIGLCYTKDTSVEILSLCCEILSEGHSHPALFNDEVITKGLMSYGVSPEDAKEYIHCTCVEITPCSTSASWVASPYINLLQVLLDILAIEGKGTPSSVDYPPCNYEITDFDSIVKAYKLRLHEVVKAEIIFQNKLQLERSRSGGDPLVSCFVNDCLKKGKDIDQGGARYNFIMPSFIGVANTVDSFYALKKLVFDKKSISMQQLIEALKANFVGYEDLRQMLLNGADKYGNDVDEVDYYAKCLSDMIISEVSQYQTSRGDVFVPSMFCWVMHDMSGEITPASPDGRLGFVPLGDGSGPAQGREKCGPTASILSSTKWDHSPFIGGIAVNMKFSKSLFQKNNLDRLEALVTSYMELGGFELQINMVDKQALLEAQKNPENYRDLVVRIGGYSDFFVRLSPNMQQEVIDRTSHEI